MVFGVVVLLLQLFLPVHDGGGHWPAMFPVLISHLMGGVRAGTASDRPIHNCVTTTAVTHITALKGRSIVDVILVVTSGRIDADPPQHRLVPALSSTTDAKVKYVLFETSKTESESENERRTKT